MPERITITGGWSIVVEPSTIYCVGLTVNDDAAGRSIDMVLDEAETFALIAALRRLV
jgi:hypothetical protein